MDLELEKQVRALIDQDQKIEAIKLVRLTTGWWLRESKDYVDALARAALPALSPVGEAVLAGRRVSRSKRSIGLSALRSLHFNNELSARIEAGTWNRLLPGDKANLDGSGSVFDVDELTDELAERCAELDIHPCGTLPALDAAAVKAASRPLRMRVGQLQWEFGAGVLWLEFTLGKGSFATSVLREVVRYTQR